MLTMNESMYLEIINTGKPLVLMASAPWCSPCRMLYSIMDKLEEAYKGRVDFYKINTDDCYDLCSSLKISGIPTLFFIVGSKISDRLIGVSPENKIIEHIEELLK